MRLGRRVLSVPASQPRGTGTKLYPSPGRRRPLATSCPERAPGYTGPTREKGQGKGDSPPSGGPRGSSGPESHPCTWPEGGELSSKEPRGLFPPLKGRSTEKALTVYLSSWVSHPLLKRVLG